MVSEVQTAVERRIVRLVGPPANRIGSEGNSREIREVPGGLGEARRLFDQLAIGGTPYAVSGGQYAREGTLLRMPGGNAFVGLRIGKDNLPTIDIYTRDGYLKLHFGQ